MVAKNFEAPVDADLNNLYHVIVRATDTAGNYTDQPIFVSVTNVLEGTLSPVTATYGATATAEAVIATVTGLDAGANETIARITPNDGRLAVASGNQIVKGLPAGNNYVLRINGVEVTGLVRLRKSQLTTLLA